jgi:hypothetical protein
MFYLAVAISCLMIGFLIGWLLYKSTFGQKQAVLLEKNEQLQLSITEISNESKRLLTEKDEYLAQFQSANGKLLMFEQEQKKAQQMQLEYQAALAQLAAVKEQLNAANEKLLTQKQDLEALGEK